MQTTESVLAEVAGQVTHISKNVDRLMPLVEHMATVEQTQRHQAEVIERIGRMLESQSKRLGQIEQRQAVSERNIRIMYSVPAVLLAASMSVSGWVTGYITSLNDFKGDTRSRLERMEFILQSPAFERAMDPYESVAEGDK